MNRAGLFKRMAKNRLAPVCAVILCVIVLGALLAPLSPYDPDALSPDKLMGPCAEHLLGTDDLGRDTFTRALYGGRVSLLVGFAAMAVAVVIGCLVGSVAGYAGGKVDAVLMRIVDVFLSVPSLLFIIVVYAFAPRNLVTLVFMLAFFSWTSVARVTRAQTLTLKQRDFVDAARALGAGHARIILRYIMPNLLPQVIVAASLAVANAILDESALSFKTLVRWPRSGQL